MEKHFRFDVRFNDENPEKPKRKGDFFLKVFVVILFVVIYAILELYLVPTTHIGMDGLQQILRFSYFHFWGSLLIGAVVFCMIAGKETLFHGLMAEGEIFNESEEKQIRVKRIFRIICGIIAGIFIMSKLLQHDYFEMQIEKNKYSGTGITKTISLIMDVEKDMKEQQTIQPPEGEYRSRYVHPEYQHDEDSNIHDYCIALYEKPLVQISQHDYQSLKNTTFNKMTHTLRIYENSGFLADVDGMTVLEYPIDKETTVPPQRDPLETEFQLETDFEPDTQIETFPEISDHWAESVQDGDMMTYTDGIYPFSFQYPAELEMIIYNDTSNPQEEQLARTRGSDPFLIDVKCIRHQEYFDFVKVNRMEVDTILEEGTIQGENVEGLYFLEDVTMSDNSYAVKIYLCVFPVSETKCIQMQCFYSMDRHEPEILNVLQSFTLTE